MQTGVPQTPLVYDIGLLSCSLLMSDGSNRSLLPAAWGYDMSPGASATALCSRAVF
jgi:hypothetical protein